jgi:hypothetical protein
LRLTVTYGSLRLARFMRDFALGMLLIWALKFDTLLDFACASNANILYFVLSCIISHSSFRVCFFPPPLYGPPLLGGGEHDHLDGPQILTLSLPDSPPLVTSSQIISTSFEGIPVPHLHSAGSVSDSATRLC